VMVASVGLRRTDRDRFSCFGRLIMVAPLTNTIGRIFLYMQHAPAL